MASLTVKRVVLPRGIRAHYCLGGIGACVPSLAGKIADKAWRGRGVRVFVLPCRSVIVVPVGSEPDRVMLYRHSRYLLATWCRNAFGEGPTHWDIVAELREAMGMGRTA